MDMFQRLTDGSFMPHGHCLLWRQDLLFLHVGGDILTAMAYFAIPLALIQFVRKRDDLVFNWIFILFAAFILFCGVTHAISLINIWHGYYYIEGFAKTMTGLISALTAVMVWRLMPQALALPSRADLVAKNNELESMQKKLQDTNEMLEQRVYERTQQLEKMATTDGLTGVPNRAELMKILSVELGRARRYSKPLCVVMIDLDNFKLINDTYGHLAGDDVIVSAATTVKELCRASDSVGRYGGEEFLLVLPETNAGDAMVLAERIREQMSQRKLVNLDDKKVTYTCSIGVAQLTEDLDQQTLLDAADKALYRAKHDGRNKVVSYG